MILQCRARCPVNGDARRRLRPLSPVMIVVGASISCMRGACNAMKPSRCATSCALAMKLSASTPAARRSSRCNRAASAAARRQTRRPCPSPQGQPAWRADLQRDAPSTGVRTIRNTRSRRQARDGDGRDEHEAARETLVVERENPASAPASECPATIACVTPSARGPRGSARPVLQARAARSPPAARSSHGPACRRRGRETLRRKAISQRRHDIRLIAAGAMQQQDGSRARLTGVSSV